MSMIFGNKIYKDFIDSLILDKVKFQGSIAVDINGKNIDARNVVINFKFNMRQMGIQPMIFNADFNNIQKKDLDGNLIISAECFLRHIFGINNLQEDFNVNGLIKNNILLRGGVKMSDKNDKKEKKINVNLTKTINVNIVSLKGNFKEIYNDRLGLKAKDKDKDKNNAERNSLHSESLYKDTLFDVHMKFYMYNFLKNIKGEDFAQENALKAIEATDEECNEFIKSCIPTQNNILDLDKLIEIISNKISANVSFFSHKGILAEFAIENKDVYIESIIK